MQNQVMRMILPSVDDILLVSSGLPSLLPQTDRTPGLHVSHIIRDQCLKLNYYDEQSDKTIDRTLMELGSTFEWALIQRYFEQEPDRYMILGEIVLDGIYGNTDLLDCYEERVKEIKFTYRSSGKVACPILSSPSEDHPIRGPKFWKDRTQLKAYCRMMEWTRGELEICHIKGNYLKDAGGKYQFKVVHNRWQTEYSKGELIGHWDGLRRHADTYACPECHRFEYEGHDEACSRLEATYEHR